MINESMALVSRSYPTRKPTKDIIPLSASWVASNVHMCAYPNYIFVYMDDNCPPYVDGILLLHYLSLDS